MNLIANAFKNINNQNNGIMNLQSQFTQVRKNPGFILDILLQNGKIDQQQYNYLQQYKNNSQYIAQYLMKTGNANEMNQAYQAVFEMMGNNQNT